MKLNETNAKRSYTMSVRAEQMAANERSIIVAVVELWMELPFHEITLDRVAERAGVTVRTILRKYGSKEGLIEACLESEEVAIDPGRQTPEPGNIQTIIEILCAEYEAMYPAVMRTIAAAEQFPAAAKILERGRQYHCEWCARAFSPFLPTPGTQAYETRLTAFIAATEIYLWKLLRRDMGKTLEEVKEVVRLLVEGIISEK